MTEILVIIGLLFLTFSLILLPQLRNPKERAGAAYGIVGAIWLIIAFGVGSWLASLVYVGGFEVLDRTIGCGWALVLFWIALVGWGVCGAVRDHLRLARSGRLLGVQSTEKLPDLRSIKTLGVVDLRKDDGI
jgi:MFS family permease